MKKIIFIFCFLFGLVLQAQVYKNGYEYIFSIEIFDKLNKPVKLVSNNKEEDDFWDLIPVDSISSRTIAYFSMELMDGKINGGQRAYFLRYYDSDKKQLTEGVTGLIENEHRIWFHPPRDKFFKILEINPFPEIRSDAEEWNTELKVGQQWGDKRWKTWEGNITIKSNYKLKDDRVIAIANSELGTSKLASTFNENKGFTLFEYENIDGSKVVFKLVEIKK